MQLKCQLIIRRRFRESHPFPAVKKCSWRRLCNQNIVTVNPQDNITRDNGIQSDSVNLTFIFIRFASII